MSSDMQPTQSTGASPSVDSGRGLTRVRDEIATILRTAGVIPALGYCRGIQGGADAVTEAFDQPLTKAQVIAIVQPFFKPTIPA